MYLQSVIDCHGRHAWVRLYTSKLPLTAVHVLNQDVLPFFEEHGMQIKTILGDDGREFCGRPNRHPYELFPQLEDREHRTLLDEHFRIKGRQKWYESREQRQKDLEEYLLV